MSLRISMLIVLALQGAVAMPVLALEDNELFKLTAPDAAEDDEFGFSVAISEDTAIVGAVFGQTRGVESGAAYLFETVTGSQTFKLGASNAAAGDRFGYSAAVDGTTAVVGAPLADGPVSDSGAAYVFETVTGTQTFLLTASDAASGDDFGQSVAVSGSRTVVGAYDDDSGAGSAYVFDTTTGAQLLKLTASDAAANDAFGWSVAISGTTAVIGAPRNDDNGASSGAAYVFDVSTGAELFKLVPSDGDENDQFGYSVAVSGTLAVIGSWLDDDNGTDSGSAYLFDTSTGTQVFKLTASDGATLDYLGFSVAVSDGVAVIGAPFDDGAGSDAGAAYAFDTTSGTEQFKITASDAASSDWFGFAVSVSSGSALVSSRLDDDGGPNSGSAYVFGSNPSQVPAFGSFGIVCLTTLLGLTAGRSFLRRID